MEIQATLDARLIFAFLGVAAVSLAFARDGSVERQPIPARTTVLLILLAVIAAAGLVPLFVQPARFPASAHPRRSR